MKHVAFVISVFCLLMAGTAVADTPPHGLGTYCSAKAGDGKWGFFFGPRPVGENCAMVRQGLARYTDAPIVRLRRGYYNLQGVNRVFIHCGFYYHNTITSVGGYALQNAYQTARYSGFTHCMFAVNSF